MISVQKDHFDWRYWWTCLIWDDVETRKKQTTLETVQIEKDINESKDILKEIRIVMEEEYVEEIFRLLFVLLQFSNFN